MERNHQFQNDVQVKDALKVSDHVSQSIYAELNNVESVRALNNQVNDSAANAHLPQIELVDENIVENLPADQALRVLTKSGDEENSNRDGLISKLGKGYMEHKHNPWNMSGGSDTEANKPAERKNDVGSLNSYFDQIDVNGDGLASAGEVHSFVMSNPALQKPENYWKKGGYAQV